jgi:hypothetical protein
MILFLSLFILCPVITALLYRKGYLRGQIISKDIHRNRLFLAGVSLFWPIGIVILVGFLVGTLVIAFCILFMDFWLWLATGKRAEKPIIQDLRPSKRRKDKNSAQ